MENRWRTFEDPFWKEPGTRGRIKKTRIDFFLSDTLTAETGKEIPLTELYARYKSFVSTRRFPSVDAELETLLRHAPTYRDLVKPMGQTALSEVGRELNVFDVTTAYPLFGELLAGVRRSEAVSLCDPVVPVLDRLAG